MGLDASNFHVIDYLRSRGIPHHTEGKGTSRGWVNLRCPYCDDRGHHMGIHLQTKRVNCWRCGPKGYITQFLMDQEDVPYPQLKDVLEDFGYDHTRKVEEVVPADVCTLPVGCVTEIPEAHRNYLLGRKFRPQVVTDKYSLRFGTVLGDFKYRIIIPIFLEGRMVNYTSRDITDLQEERYKTCPNSDAEIFRSHLLYNVNNWKQGSPLVIVEGPLDVWRIGDGAVSTLGTSFSPTQIRLLSSLAAPEYFILFDGEADAVKKSIEMAKILSMLGKKSSVLECPVGKDPGSLSFSEVVDLRKEINLMGSYE